MNVSGHRVEKTLQGWSVSHPGDRSAATVHQKRQSALDAATSCRACSMDRTSEFRQQIDGIKKLSPHTLSKDESLNTTNYSGDDGGGSDGD